MSSPADAPPRRNTSLRTIGAGLVIVLGVLVAVTYFSTRDTPQIPGSGRDAVALQDRPPADRHFALPPAELEGFAGGPPVALTEFRGEPLVVNFWATWCAPCVREMPEFEAAATELRGKVTFLGVDVEDAPPNAEPFVESLGISYPLAIDPRRDFYHEVGNFGMPTTLLVDADGVVRYRYTGPLERERLYELLAEHLDVAP